MVLLDLAYHGVRNKSNLGFNNINKLLDGKSLSVHERTNRGDTLITADTALRLGKWFRTGPKIWLNLQQAYDLDVAEGEIGSDLEIIRPRQAA